MAEFLPQRQRGRGEDPRAAPRLHQRTEALRDVERHETQAHTAGCDLEGARALAPPAEATTVARSSSECVNCSSDSAVTEPAAGHGKRPVSPASAARKA